MRAAAFGRTWRDAAYEKGDTQSLYNDFFEVFDVRGRSEEHVAKLDKRSRFIDLFWPGVLIVEQKCAGRDLGKAYGQAGEYFDALPERGSPRYILANDFQTFELQDLDERETVSFSLPQLAVHREEFRLSLGSGAGRLNWPRCAVPPPATETPRRYFHVKAYPLSYRPCAQSKPYSMT